MSVDGLAGRGADEVVGVAVAVRCRRGPIASKPRFSCFTVLVITRQAVAGRAREDLGLAGALVSRRSTV
jgi:hypothetical protein